MRGAGLPGTFILPFLAGCSLISLIPAFIAWRACLKCGNPSVISYFAAAILFYALFALISGFGVTLAEDLAAATASQFGNPGPNGPRDFYPNDSGMSHWPTEWHRVPATMAYMAVVWFPLVLLLLFLIATIEKHLKAPKKPTTAS